MKWYLLPLVCALFFFGRATTDNWEISSRNEAARMASYPVISDEKIWKQFDQIKQAAESNQTLTPDQYFATMAELKHLELADIRNRYFSPGVQSNGLFPLQMRTLQNQIANEHVRELTTQSVQVQVEAARKKHPMPREQYKNANGEEFTPFVLAYLLTALTAAPLFFMVRLRRHRLMVGVELLFRLPFWSLLWPVGLFKYPTNINPLQQVRRFKQWLAAMVGVLLGLAPAGLAHAKSGGRLGDVETVQVDQQRPIITAGDPPKPQLLPTVVVDDTRFDFRGWAHVQASSNQPLNIAMLKVRFLVNDQSRSGLQLFSQFNLQHKGAIDELWVGHKTGNVTIKVGHQFHQGGNSSVAPFLIETIQAPNLPISFFGTGIGVEGAANDNLTWGASVTGDSESKAFSRATFGRLELSGNVKRSFDKGFVRFSAQQAGDLRIIVDAEQAFGRNKVRAAVHYRTKSDQVGGYVLFSTEVGKTIAVFSRLEMDNRRFRALAGLLVPLNDNVNLTMEVTDSNGVALRTRLRF